MEEYCDWVSNKVCNELTVNFLCKQLPVDHPVGIEDNVACNEPGRIFMLKVNSLTDDSKTDQYDEEDNDEI